MAPSEAAKTLTPRRFPIPCATCGQPTRNPQRGRCPTCHALSRTRYGHAHQATREALAPIVATGTVPCSRCAQLITPGDPWDLDHRTGQSLPSHATCNRSAGGRP